MPIPDSSDPDNSFDRLGDTTHAAPMPMTVATVAIAVAEPAISRAIWPLLAPSALRMPMSRVRSAVLRTLREKMPTAARMSAVMAMSVKMKTAWLSEFRICA